MDPIIFAQLNEAYHNGVYEKKELEPDPFGRPGGKHGGVPAPGSGYDRAWKAIQKKNKENKKNTNEELDIQEWVEALIEEGYNLDEYSDDELYEAYLKEAFISPYKSRPSYNNPQGHSPAMKALQKSDELQKTEPGSTRQKDQTRRAGHLAKMFKAGRDTMREELDLYDLVSEYLVSEGFCDSYEDADVIMVNMSEEWRDGILDEVTGGGKIKFRKGLPGRSPKKAGMEMTPQQKAALRLGKMDVNPSTDPARRERQAKVALR
jgi:hypothetical protein